MADHTVVSNEQPLSSVEIATRQKGPPAVTVKVYHADPDVAAAEALRIYAEVFLTCASPIRQRSKPVVSLRRGQCSTRYRCGDRRPSISCRSSGKKIATDLQCSVRTVFMRLHGAGVPSRPIGKVKPYGPNHRNWKGGRSVAPSGYVYLSVQGRRIPEHRYVMEQQLGRLLTTREHVHHLNHIRDDNRPENLVVVDVGDHGRLHLGRCAGALNGRAVLTNEAVQEMRRRREQGAFVRVLMAEFGVSRSTVKRIITNQSWKEEKRTSEPDPVAASGTGGASSSEPSSSSWRWSWACSPSPSSMKARERS
jgi:hypothetical protein